MGTFLSTIGDIVIDKAERTEFRDMYIKVATAGGMMDVERGKIFGRDFSLLAPLKIENDGSVVVSYNYFEDTWWESGAFNYEHGEVFSCKVGWRQFNIVSSALELLSEFNSSTEGYASGERVLSLDVLTGWLNYVLDTKYDLKKRRNALHIYEMLKKEQDDITLADICHELEPYGLCSHHELMRTIFAEMPVDEAIKFFEDSDQDKQSRCFLFSPGHLITVAQETIQKWQESGTPLEQQMADIKKFLAKTAEYVVSGEKGWGEKNKDVPYTDDFLCVYMLGLDVFTKIFLYKTGIDDEELRVYASKPLKMKKPEWMVHNEDCQCIPAPISTQDILCYRDPDDMAYWWKSEGDIVLSDNFWSTLDSIKKRYQEIRENMAGKKLMDGLSLMRELADIGARCEEIFGLPIIFGDFFYEMTSYSQSLDNQALVKLLDEYVKEYGARHEKEKDEFTNRLAIGSSENYKMLKKLSAVLANKNLRELIL